MGYARTPLLIGFLDSFFRPFYTLRFDALCLVAASRQLWICRRSAIAGDMPAHHTTSRRQCYNDNNNWIREDYYASGPNAPRAMHAVHPPREAPAPAHVRVTFLPLFRQLPPPA